MDIGAASNLLGGYERDFANDEIPRDEDPAELGKMDFLKLLITQLENQDPLDPMDDKEFVAQLAQFSSLEQLTNISEGMESMNENQARQEMLGAVGFIGKEIRADGDGISKDGSGASKIFYNLEDTAQNLYFNIYDENGNMVRTVEKSARQSGDYEFEWDGLNFDGAEAPDGNYSVSISAEGPNGEPVMVNTEMTGRVSGVQDKDGQPHLRLSDGRMLRFADVSEVVGDGSSNSNNNNTEDK
ncbi:flagellar hook capping FlgD N-terminal domain-containing protein [Desulfonatronospira sp. MSAO_Bac3]|uniref:flagellar hook assembly protein FlgD n=1 Tax=Desulfonatronospira sp. MSAO_Bac3 TaxID=2293857 RepID=UPI000FF56C8C|nr:flagellar hook capping FlgD N-terminal domain-containing protein [Desulfonatronospira sp. MSAO_Bac3]RQD75020.1 MAG: flagellar hook assembly protein FlgD [Desulfonatronospira sp. MSAO_Bac3]